MKITRRQFLKGAAATGIGLALPLKFGVRSAHAFGQSPGLSKFTETFRLLPPLAASDVVPWQQPGTTHYTIQIKQFTDKLHSALGPTTLWGFGQGPVSGFKHLGGIIVAQKGTPVQLTIQNRLTSNEDPVTGTPLPHILPVDTTIMGAGNVLQNRTATHLHGGFVPWISDGGPFAWFAPDGTTAGSPGPSFSNNQVLRPTAPNYDGEYYYPNDQSARLVWYHDHTFGITRLSAYAGIATAYVIRDGFEASLVGMGLPDFIEKGGFEIPIVIQDKIFVNSATIGALDPTWPKSTTTGTLWYAHVYDPKRYKLAGNKKGTGAIPDPSVVPEFFGDTMLANGTVYPEVTVEARRYRLRILNACQARFMNLQLYVDNGSADSITLNPLTLAPTNSKGPDFLQIGSEGGLLPEPVLVPSNVPFNPITLGGSLILAPAERADVIIDFSGYTFQKIILYSDAPAPFPVGDPRNDYFPGAPANPTITTPGFGPNTRQIMRFNVIQATSLDPTLKISPATDLTPGNDPLLAQLVVGGIPIVPLGTPVRRLTLNETFDAFGRLIQLLGTDTPLVNVGSGFGRGYLDPATEVVQKDAIEVWQIINLTGDTHPIHFHLVNVQIISRQPFRVSNYNGGAPTFTGPARPPDLNEQGWKETVRMNPGEVTTVIMNFKLPLVPFTVPNTPRANGPIGGFPGLNVTLLPGQTAHEYVWHCHILEHEEHDMMRPLVVVS